MSPEDRASHRQAREVRRVTKEDEGFTRVVYQLRAGSGVAFTGIGKDAAYEGYTEFVAVSRGVSEVLIFASDEGMGPLSRNTYPLVGSAVNVDLDSDAAIRRMGYEVVK